MNDIKTKSSKGLKGEIVIPPDKSISHRGIIIGSLTGGKIKISNFSKGGDCRSTLEIFKNLGLKTEFLDEKTLVINSREGLSAPGCPLNCGNSGTSMRLLSGLLAGQKFNSILFGDKSLSKRNMRRIVEPLGLMGAKISSDNGFAPLKITGSKLNGIEYKSEIPSAQVKSCMLLAGFNAIGETTVTEPYLSRNHTEIMLENFEADIKTGKSDKGFFTKIRNSFLIPKDIFVPGDISSAAFFLTAGAIVPKSEIIIKNVGLNPTRTGIVDVLKQMNADIEIIDLKKVNNEDMGDIKIKSSPDLRGIEIGGGIIPKLIDEIPVICVLAAFAKGTTVIKNASDLKNKESDRILCTAIGLKKMGIEIEPTEDGFIIEGGGGKKIEGGVELETYNDHRLAMTFYTAGLMAEKSSLIKDFGWVNTSFPEFLNLFGQL